MLSNLKEIVSTLKGIISIIAIVIFIAGFVVNRFKQGTEKTADIETGTVVLETKSIDEIWALDEKTDFVVHMYLYVADKCNYGEKIEELNEAQRAFYIAQELEAEVNNGGFSQFFFNSNGIFADELVSSFEKIEAFKTAEICKKAISIFGDKIPSDREEIQDILVPDDEEKEEEMSAILNECDLAFYEYEDDLAELNYQFIIKNKESFIK